MHVHESVFGISAEAAGEAGGIAAGAEDWLPVDGLFWLTFAMALAAVLLALV